MKSKWTYEIPGFENIKGYKVYENGEVHSYRIGKTVVDEVQKVLNGYPNTKGYLLVDLSTKKRGVKVHRLVAMAFLPNPENKPQVNHIDGDKTNNNLNNLQWVTNGENQKHAFKLGLNQPHIKEKNYQYRGGHKNCKVVRQMDLEGNEIAIHKSIAIAGRSLGKGYTTITKACHGEIPTAYGYKWEFVK